MTAKYLKLIALVALAAKFSSPCVADETVQKSTVLIQVGYVEQDVFHKVEEGSGFLVHPNGWIVTAKHIAEAAVPEGKQRVFFGSVGSKTAQKIELFDVATPAVSSDIAMLRFSPSLMIKWDYLKILPNHQFSTEDHVKALGFPFGKEMEVRPGVVSNLLGPKGSVGVNVGLAPGMSGGPVVLENTRCVVGIVAGGSGYPSYDYFTPVQLAKPILEVPPAEFVVETLATSREVPEPLFERSFQIDQTKDDHEATRTSKYYDFSFNADPNARIVSAKWIEESAAADSDKSLNIVDDGAVARFRFRLESGPFYDQTRGWWHGKVILTEQSKTSSAHNALPGCV